MIKTKQPSKQEVDTISYWYLGCLKLVLVTASLLLPYQWSWSFNQYASPIKPITQNVDSIKEFMKLQHTQDQDFPSPFFVHTYAIYSRHLNVSHQFLFVQHTPSQLLVQVQGDFQNLAWDTNSRRINTTDRKETQADKLLLITCLRFGSGSSAKSFLVAIPAPPSQSLEQNNCRSGGSMPEWLSVLRAEESDSLGSLLGCSILSFSSEGPPD